MSEPVLTRRDLLARLAGVAALPAAAAAYGRSAAATSASQITGPLHYASLADVAGLIAAREIQSSDLTQQMLDRIAAVDGRLQSYVTVMAEQAIASARRADAEIRAGRYRGPLHGVPIGVKDLCYTRGVRTMAGTKVFADFVPDYDATVVARLEAAGAVILGKLVLCEGAFGPYFPGLQVPVNPWDATRWSGVSSSGSGVATAAGLCFASVGTDTGGSIRYPSAANGCVGLKPTYGRVSRYGVFALAPSMDHVGPMTRTVEDAAILFEAMAGADPLDPTSLPDPVSATRSELRQGVAGLRIGFDRRYATDNVDADVAEAMDEVLATLTRLGANVVAVTMPDVSQVGGAWLDLCYVEALAVHASTFPSRAGEYGPGFRAALEAGQRVTPSTLAAADSTSIGSLGVDRIHAEDRRLPGVPVDGQQRTRQGSESFRRRNRRVLECDRPERHPHPAVQLQRQSHLVGAVRVLGGRPAAQRAVRRPAAERIGAVPHRPRVRAGDAVALETPGGLVLIL